MSNHSLDVSIFFSKSRAKQILQSAGKPKQTACHLFIGVEVDVNKHLKKIKRLKKDVLLDRLLH